MLPTHGTVPRVRSLSRRVAELPSLRYGPIGAASPVSGPLRVSIVQEPSPNRAQHVYVRTTSEHPLYDSVPTLKLASTGRHVRFDVPSAEPGSGTGGGGGPPERRGNRATTRASPATAVTVATSGVRRRDRVHPVLGYVRGTLSPTSAAAAPASGGRALLRAARDADDHLLRDALQRALLTGISEPEVNAADTSGRTVISYVASNGPLDLLEMVLQLPGLDPNLPDNEGNTPLHFASQAGQVECMNFLLSRCQGLEIDARNNLGLTPLMKAAVQGRNKCAKLLLFAGANPTLRDTGRGLRAEQWARYCGRYVCADVIEKFARHRLLERSTSCGRWGSDNDIGTKIFLGKVVPVPQIPPPPQGLRSRLRKVFRTTSGPGSMDTTSSARLVSQLTSAALCASGPALPGAPSVPPVVRSLLRPLTVPRLQITLAAGGSPVDQPPSPTAAAATDWSPERPAVRPPRSKKKLK